MDLKGDTNTIKKEDFNIPLPSIDRGIRPKKKKNQLRSKEVSELIYAIDKMNCN